MRKSFKHSRIKEGQKLFSRADSHSHGQGCTKRKGTVLKRKDGASAQDKGGNSK